MFCGGLQVLSTLKPFFHEVILEILPALLHCGLVLLCNHLVIDEHRALTHSCPCHHCHFLDACCNATVGKRGLKRVKASEVSRNACCWVPLLPVPLGLVLKLLGGGQLDCRLLSKV